MVTNLNCPGGTALHSDTLDNVDPLPPDMTYVTVQNGQSLIYWKPSISPETVGYQVYQIIPGTVQGSVIGHTSPKTNTSFVDPSGNPNDSSITYSVASVDSCSNLGLINTKTQHTIFLQSRLDTCARTFNLTWNFYDNWVNGVDSYYVYAGLNGNQPVLLQPVPNNNNAYSIQVGPGLDNLTAYVVAHEAGTTITSASNIVNSEIKIVKPAYDLYIQNVTVASPGSVNLDFSIGQQANLTNLILERSTNGLNYAPVASLPPAVNGAFQYTDTANTSAQTYWYRLISIDNCQVSDTSSIGSTILLRAVAFSDRTSYLQWNAPSFTYGTILKYHIFRDDGIGFNEIKQLNSDSTLFFDVLSTGYSACYYITADLAMNFPNGTQANYTANSNQACVQLPDQIFVPNAFKPEGKNNIFKPFLRVASYKSYSMTIYNRWGQEIFSSQNPDDGWDGRYKDQLVQQDTYAYLITVVTGNDVKLEKKGTLMVLR
jgi:gliding motility-associated-like protein